MIKTDLVSNLPSSMQERVNNTGSDMEKWLAERKERAKYIDDLSLENESDSEDGIEFYFVNEFITGDLRIEISAIAKDFFANCADVCRQVDEKKDELHAVDYFTGDYDKASYGINMIGDQFSLMVIHYLYYGTKLGNEFCKKQLIALHRTFHKKEYNSIKRFSKLTGYDIFDILGDGMSDGSAARIIIISRLIGIEVEKDRNFEVICKLTNKHLRESIPKEKYSKIYDDDYHDEDCKSFDHNLSIAEDIVNKYLTAYKKDITIIKFCIRNTAYRYFSVNEKLYNMSIVENWLRNGSICLTLCRVSLPFRTCLRCLRFFQERKFIQRCSVRRLQDSLFHLTGRRDLLSEENRLLCTDMLTLTWMNVNWLKCRRNIKTV